MVVIRIVTQLIPVVREVVRATSRQSPGGKRITPEEFEAILQLALDKIARILRRELVRA